MGRSLALPLPDIPLAPLRTFYLVVRHNSFSGAAHHLGVTQPAVTQQIRRLERALGVALFHRDGRRLVLTEAGETLETFAERIFQLTEAAREALGGIAAVRTGHLTLGASRTAGAYYVSGLLDRFKRRFPAVRVSLSVGNSQTVLAGILDFSLHAGLIAGHPDDPRLAARPLIRDRMLVVLPPGHLLARRRAVTVEDLRGLPLILREPGSTTRHLIEQAFRTHNVPAEPTMELESNEAIKSAVADRIGVALMARAAVAQELAAGRLAARPLRPALTLDFALVYHGDRALSPLLAAFLELLPEPPARRGRHFRGPTA